MDGRALNYKIYNYNLTLDLRHEGEFKDLRFVFELQSTELAQ